LLGIARGAIQHFVETTRIRHSAYTGKNIADFTNIQVDLSEAAALADAAEAIALRDCDEATRITEAGVVPSIEQRARYRRDGAFAATLCTKAVDLLFAASGGGAIYERNPIQRAFRDVHAANAHYVLNWSVSGAVYGRVALGLPPDAPL
jgi:3-hydroxy-9,10-secoandrosta-1,3,5(10)-triene-9,17-dione monooxygenase